MSGQVVKEIEIVHKDVKYTFQITLVAEESQVPGPTPSIPPSPVPVLEELKISTVKSNRHDGTHAANNMLSPNEARWSCKGKDCEALFDLGTIQEVGQVFITFFKGGERTENFQVGFSDDDKTYAFVEESQQNQASAIVSINPFIKARYVKLLGKGNNVNDWNSVEYVKISGRKLGEPQPEPEPEPLPECPPGQHRDPATGQCVSDGGPGPDPTPGRVIEEGVLMLYPKIGEAKKFKYGSSNEGRAQWSTDNGKCMVNQEVTAVLHLKAITNMGEEVSLKLRGGRHSDDDPDEGSCYIIGVKYKGTVNKQWEEPHPSNHAFPGHDKPGNFAVESLNGKKIGVKAIVFLQGDHDHLECWLDTDPVKADGTFANNYRKFWEHDTKEFTGKCNGNRTLIRCDDIKGAPENPEAELIYGSTREIDISRDNIATMTGKLHIAKTLEDEKNESATLKPTKELDDEEDDENLIMKRAEATSQKVEGKSLAQAMSEKQDKDRAKTTTTNSKSKQK